MMAVSALSLAHQDGGQNIDALQHYQQAFPSLQTCLRSNQDLSSDGLFLTHFLLLVYEVGVVLSLSTLPSAVAYFWSRSRQLSLVDRISGHIISRGYYTYPS